MLKDYEEFVEALRQGILAVTGLTESEVYFRKKGERFAENGDRLFVECAAHKEGKEVCGLYSQELYEHYLDGMSMKKIVQDVNRELKRVTQAGFFKKTQNLSEYSKAKQDLFIRLLNAVRNEKDLRHAVYRTVGDIALVLYMKVGEANGCVTSIKIRKEYIEGWGMDSEKVLEDAILNTYFMSPPRIYHWEKLMVNPNYEGEIFMDLLAGCQLNKNSTGNCLSTTKRTNGAVAIFLPGVARRLADLMGQDLYLVFTSIHEVMVHNVKRANPVDLKNILADTIREATPKEDYLTSSIYYYSRKTGKITCLETI